MTGAATPDGERIVRSGGEGLGRRQSRIAHARFFRLAFGLQGGMNFVGFQGRSEVEAGRTFLAQVT